MRYLLNFWAGRHRFTLFFIVMATVMLSSPAPVRAESDVFPVPGIIKHNVAFWIRIYTEVSLQEGLLHDRDFPQIVYEKSPTGNRTGKARSEFIGGRIKIYSDAIIAVRDSAPDKWGTVEKRVAAMFKNAPEGAIDEAETRIRHQTGQRERFRQGVERSGMYIDTISAILKKHGVPDELKYLPHVESSFDANAYSKVGASGLWQFMRATGRGYMRIDYMIDERSDPIISSEAAARFLRANYDMLKTWPLAITGYNSGPNGMRRAVDNLGTRDIAIILEKHESASFKFASRNFYACFLAVLEIMEKPEVYLKGVKPRPRWQATNIKLPFSIKPAALCKSLNITEQEFRRLNPAFRPVAFKEQRNLPEGYAVNLPHTMNADEALAAINKGTPPPQRVVAAATQTQTGTNRDRDTDIDTEAGYYKIVRGDNLQAIAKRLGVPMAELAATNNITNSSRIYVGQILRIPGKSAPSSIISDSDTVLIASVPPTKPDTVRIASVPSTKPDTVRTASAPSTKPDTVKTASAPSTPSAPPEPETPAFSDIRITITWQSFDPEPADTAITAAAAAPSSKPDTASKAPALDTATVKADTVLTDTLSAAALREAEPAPAAVPTDPSGKPSPDTRFDAEVYNLGMTVAPGGASVRIRVAVDETLSQFANWMRVYVDDIRRANNMGPNAAPVPGRTINIPVKNSANIKRFEVRRLEHHMAIEEDFFARYDVTDFEQRRVKPGDNLWRIRRDAQVPMWLLRKYNRGDNFYNLQPGTRLWIPKITPKTGEAEDENEFSPAAAELEDAE